MSTRRIRLVIGLASVALLGILAMQGFWIKRAWNIHTFNYNHRIHQAAIHTASRLEKSHLREVLKNKNHNAVIRIHEEDNGHSDSRTIVMNSSAPGVQSQIIVVNGDTIKESVITRAIAGGDDTSVNIWQAHAEDLAIEEIISDSLITMVFESLPVDSIINAELNKEGLDLAYSYEIVTEDSGRRRNKKKFRRRGDAMVPLFRRTSGDVPMFLKIKTSREGESLPFWFIAMILCSLLFSSIMIWAFWYVVRGLLHQKKISDVKTDFINNMTHEFKTPISTISLAVDAMKIDKVKSDKSQVEYYSKIIGAENSRMNQQVERVLQASQLEKGELLIERTDLDMSELIDRVVSNFELIIKERNGHISVLKEDEVQLLKGDEHHLYNVINNLLDNAIKYSEDEPIIVIRLQQLEDVLRLSVKDQGIGMTKEEQKQLFKKFFRANQGDLHNVKGFGLGLNYVQYIVQQHGGSIEVKSQKGLGTEFIINLPAQ